MTDIISDAKRVDYQLDRIKRRANAASESNEILPLTDEILRLAAQYPQLSDNDHENGAVVERYAIRLRMYTLFIAIAQIIGEDDLRTKAMARGDEAFEEFAEEAEEVDRTFSQICESAGVSPLVRRYLSKDKMREIEIALNDATPETAIDELTHDVLVNLIDGFLVGERIISIVDPDGHSNPNLVAEADALADEFLRTYESCAVLLRVLPVTPEEDEDENRTGRLEPFFWIEDELERIEAGSLLERYMERILRGERGLAKTLRAFGCRPTELEYP
jgi:hypothetical protein